MTTIIAAGGLVFNEEEALLMIYRRGYWDLPKGKLDKGETIEECALREVEEETGLQQITLGKLVGLTHHMYFDKWLKEDVIKESHWYAMQAGSKQKLVPQTEEDIIDIRWVKEKELPNYLPASYPNIVEIIQKYYGHAF